ncbi:MAG: phosphate ABC transporter permease PstA [Phycisphaerales bacterium]|nr:phosphate ABC transporter permease PstA [Phycisphaerales bacterium]
MMSSADAAPDRPRKVRSMARRALANRLFLLTCLCVTSLSVVVLAVLLITILMKGWHFLDWGFITNSPSRNPEESGIWAALWGSLSILVVCAASALPLGVGTAVFMEEFKPRRRWQLWVYNVIQLNVRNLAGVPSIVYGIIGLTVFTNMFGLFGTESRYDDFSRVRLADGSSHVGLIWDESETEMTFTDMYGVHYFPLGGDSPQRVVDIDDAFVSTWTATLSDGREVTGRLSSVDPEWDENDEIVGATVDLRTEDGEDLVFDAALVQNVKRRDRFQIGDEDWYFVIRFPFGPSVLTGGLTLMLVILPIVVISAQEAIRAVPSSLREGALAIGCSKWQMVQKMVLPNAIPGIMTGAILAMSRAIGEAAPILVIGGAAFVTFTPNNLMSNFAAMPLQIYNWTGRPQEEFQMVAATGIIVLLALLLLFNSTAVFIRQKFSTLH